MPSSGQTRQCHADPQVFDNANAGDQRWEEESSSQHPQEQTSSQHLCLCHSRHKHLRFTVYVPSPAPSSAPSKERTISKNCQTKIKNGPLPHAPHRPAQVSRRISRAEAGNGMSKLVRTSGCSIPITPTAFPRRWISAHLPSKKAPSLAGTRL